MKAVRFHGKEDLRYESIPEPVCGKGQIKIKPAWFVLPIGGLNPGSDPRSPLTLTPIPP